MALIKFTTVFDVNTDDLYNKFMDLVSFSTTYSLNPKDFDEFIQNYVINYDYDTEFRTELYSLNIDNIENVFKEFLSYKEEVEEEEEGDFIQEKQNEIIHLQYKIKMLEKQIKDYQMISNKG